MASASSSKKVAAPKMPQSRLFESGHMSYAVKGADLVLDESWVSLETVAGLPKDANVGPVEFDYGIKICQKTKTAKCTLELGPQQYTDSTITPGAQAFNFVRVIFKCTGPYKLQLEGDAAGELPLARLCGDALAFEYIRLAVLFRKLKPKAGQVADVLIGQLKTFLTAHVTLDTGNPWNPIPFPPPKPQQVLPPETTTTMKRDRGDEDQDVDSLMKEVSLAKAKLKRLEAAEEEASARKRTAMAEARKAAAEAEKATADVKEACNAVIELQDQLIAQAIIESRKRGDEL